MANTGVELMPLPDAPAVSPRVYTILKTKTLEAGDGATQLSFSDIQSVGNTISVELLNEDELRRLVLVNLARLTTKSDWAGLF